ncbi:transposase, partial [Gluconobacter oxydans]|uniref:transposase n=1 Tax=Gluconobacter oxydans TaxID=442 RepID=UPI0039EA3AAB
IIKTLPDEAWVRCSSGHGTKGERLYDWLYCPMADLQASDYSDTLTGTWTRGLLVRRNPADGDLRYFTTWCPQGTLLKTLVRVEGTRWRIEEGFETAKNEFGLDHNETRSWHGWHRHVTLVMLAYAMMAAVRSQANALALKKSPRPTRKSSSGGRSRKSDASP